MLGKILHNMNYIIESVILLTLLIPFIFIYAVSITIYEMGCRAGDGLMEVGL